MYGTQTRVFNEEQKFPFENDVKMYGTQTEIMQQRDVTLFENDVKMYGTQTATAVAILNLSLSLM